MDKAPEAFRTISEVADEIDVPQHVLRFWESRFTQIRPMKRGGGRRYYRPDDVDLLRGVRHLLYGEGYTIRGVQRILRDQGSDFVQNVWRAGAELPPPELEDDKLAIELDGTKTAGAGEPGSLLSFLSSAGRKSGAPAEQQTGEPPNQRSMHSGARHKLRGALDELVACQRLIEAALADHAALPLSPEAEDA